MTPEIKDPARPARHPWRMNSEDGRATAPAPASEDGLASGHRDAGARDVAAVIGGEQHVDRGELGGLAGAAERHVLAERLDLLGREAGRDEGRPDGPGGDAVDADPTRAEHLRE